MSIRFEALNSTHDRKSFACKKTSFNDWLQNVAMKSQNEGMCKTWVALNEENIIVGYYCLSAWLIDLDEIPDGTFKKRPKLSQISAALIGKLATGKDYEKMGIGRAMIWDAAKRLDAGPMGVHSLALHALQDDQELLDWYIKTGFTPLKSSTHYLFLPMATIMATIAEYEATMAASSGTQKTD